MIKAIETVYNGYKFRSRLEARWAIFFDTLEIKYEYELEGFNLKENGYYLPDFYLPDVKCWIEIKPQYNLPANLLILMEEFSWQIGAIILFIGKPIPTWNGQIFAFDLTDSSGGIYFNDIGFAYCNKCNKTVLSLSDTDSRFINGERTIYIDQLFENKLNICDPEHRKTHTIKEIEIACEKAKQARFEFNG